MATEAFDHLLDDMVGTDAQAITEHLNRKMTIAEMPGDLYQFAAVGRGNFNQFLWFGADAHDGAIWQGEAVSVAEMYGLWQIQLYFSALCAMQYDPTAVAVIVVQQYVIDFTSGIPGAGGQDAFATHQNRK
jgi:hypothetical protein